MSLGHPSPSDPIEIQWQNIYAGQGGWVGTTYWHPGHTPQGAVVYAPGAKDPAPKLNPSATTSSASSSNAAALADPFASQRSQYQTQLSDLVKDPSSFLSSPLHKATTDYGVQAINRSAAAKGQLNSGNRLTDLLRYGQATGAENYYKQADLLSTLSGATTSSPAAAASAQTAANALADSQARYKEQQEQLLLEQQNARNTASTQNWIQNNRDYANKNNFFAY